MGEVSLRASQYRRVRGIAAPGCGTILRGKPSIKNLATLLIVLFFSFSLSGCSIFNQALSPNIIVNLPPEHRMHFSGKGAGAGMMMAASMGPMGIAIGVAIDEGIAKDIGRAANEAGVDVAGIVLSAFENAFVGRAETLEIAVVEYGFVTQPGVEGVEDPVVAYLELVVNGSDQVLESYDICELHSRELATVKMDGVVVVEALVASAECLANFYILSDIKSRG